MQMSKYNSGRLADVSILVQLPLHTLLSDEGNHDDRVHCSIEYIYEDEWSQ